MFSNEGVGTLIYANEYHQIRRAMKKDIRSIILLDAKFDGQRGIDEAEAGPRMEKQIGDYFLFEIDKNPVACVALHVYPDQSKGELACLYVRAARTRTRASGAS